MTAIEKTWHWQDSDVAEFKKLREQKPNLSLFI